MANRYFSLSDSNATRTKKFSVVLGSYLPTKFKTQTISQTVSGLLDIAIGSILEKHTYVIRVRENETRDGYGDKDDLDYFYGLNNPNGSPSNILTFVTHYGVSRLAIMSGDFSPQPLSVQLEGEEAWFTISCVFNLIPE